MNLFRQVVLPFPGSVNLYKRLLHKLENEDEKIARK